jgi:hypothetical protein
MTEAEWVTSTDPAPMLQFLRGRASDRKLRLFAVACCRRVWHLIIDERSRRAIEAAEDGVDEDARLVRTTGAREEASMAVGEIARRVAGARTPAERVRVHMQTKAAGAALAVLNQSSVWGIATGADLAALRAARAAAVATKYAARVSGRAGRPTAKTERAKQCGLLRDIFGLLPFRPVTVHPDVLACNDQLVVRLAQSIYDERRWAELGILHDALLDAGCGEQEVLDHCKGPGPHSRGCWILDVLLNKE